MKYINCKFIFVQKRLEIIKRFMNSKVMWLEIVFDRFYMISNIRIV